MTAAERTSRWARRFVLSGAAFLVLWQAGELAGAGRRTAVTLGLLGFVLHTVFGKAYSLVPAYFDRDLATTRLLPIHLACTVLGTVGLSIDARWSVPSLTVAGSALWGFGAAIFLATLVWSLRDNLSGSETATGRTDAERRPVDRFANAFVPIALVYLAAGTYALLASHTGLPPVVDGYAPRASHLLAAGAAALLLFAVGFRLLPRFLVASPPTPLVVLVLPAGAAGPVLLAVGLHGGMWLQLGAVLEAVAVIGFATAYVVLFSRSERRRVGFYGALAGAVAGVLAVGLGLALAFEAVPATAATAHFRLALLGFLGLFIVGISYQFYPPAAGSFHGASDRTAFLTIALLAGGLLTEVVGLLGPGGALAVAVPIGRIGATTGALVHLYLLGRLFRERYG